MLLFLNFKIQRNEVALEMRFFILLKNISLTFSCLLSFRTRAPNIFIEINLFFFCLSRKKIEIYNSFKDKICLPVSLSPP